MTMDADIIEMPEQEQETPLVGKADAARQIVCERGGFALRYCAGRHAQLQWQAGIVVTETRMIGYLSKPMSIFWLKGFGASQEDAIAMAREGIK